MLTLEERRVKHAGYQRKYHAANPEKVAGVEPQVPCKEPRVSHWMKRRGISHRRRQERLQQQRSSKKWQTPSDGTLALSRHSSRMVVRGYV